MAFEKGHEPVTNFHTDPDQAPVKKKIKVPTEWQLKTPKNTRQSLSRLFRLRYNKQIESDVCKDLVSIVRTMLDHDKHLRDITTEQRLEAIEALVRGEGGTVIDPALLKNPLLADMKKQIAAVQKTNSELNSDLLEARQKANELQAEMDLMRENGQTEN